MKWHPEYVVLLAIVLATIFYLGLDGVPLDHPGNLKASDPFYHVLMVESIMDSHQWNYFPAWLALNNPKAMNEQPPLLYMQAAVLSLFSGVPSWISIYFIVCFFAALGIGICYFVIKRMFQSTSVALLAALALLLPLQPSAWLYQIYIGFWLQVVSFTFVLAFVWMALEYLHDKQVWCLWIANLAVVAIMLIHPQDLFPIFPLWLLTLYRALKQPERFKHAVALISFSLVIFLVMVPHFFGVWAAWGGQLTPKLSSYSQSYYQGMSENDPTFPSIAQFPLIVTALMLLGAVFVVYRWKQYIGWIAIVAVYLWIVYLSPFFLAAPYYLFRLRSLQPFFLLPFVAYLVVAVMMSIKIDSRIKTGVFIAIGILLIASAYPSYAKIRTGLQGEHIGADKWAAFEWIHKNTPATATVFMVEGESQACSIFMKRITAAIEPNELVAHIIAYQENKTIPDLWTVGWNGNTVRGFHSQEVDFFHFTHYPTDPRNATLNSFDYVYMENQNAQVAQVNELIRAQLLVNYSQAYNRNGYMILKRRS